MNSALARTFPQILSFTEKGDEIMENIFKLGHCQRSENIYAE